MKINFSLKGFIAGACIAATLAMSSIVPAYRVEASNTADLYASTSVPLKTPKYNFNNFKPSKTYKDDFTDLNEASEWARENIKSAFGYNIINGKGEGKFDPKGNMTYAEAIKIGAMIHATYAFGRFNVADVIAPYQDPNSKDGWAGTQGYIAYAKAYNLVGNEFDGKWEKQITRRDMVHTWAKILQTGDKEKNNTIYSLPDVSSDSKYYSEIIEAYELGIVIGNDSNGTFKPESNITREEATAIFMRIVDKNQRKKIGTTLGTPKTIKVGGVDWTPALDIVQDSHNSQKMTYAAQNRFIEAMLKQSEGIKPSADLKSFDFSFNMIELPEGYKWSMRVYWDDIDGGTGSRETFIEKELVSNGKFSSTQKARTKFEAIGFEVCIQGPKGTAITFASLDKNFKEGTTNVLYSTDEMAKSVEHWLDLIFK